MKFPESIEYHHTLLTLRKIAENYPCTTIFMEWRHFDADAQRAMGPGVGFGFADSVMYLAAATDVEKQMKGFWLHPDSLRFFMEYCLIFVRRPNCHNCGEVCMEHVRGKCLFVSTDYSDNYAPLLKAVDRAGQL